MYVCWFGFFCCCIELVHIRYFFVGLFTLFNELNDGIVISCFVFIFNFNFDNFMCCLREIVWWSRVFVCHFDTYYETLATRCAHPRDVGCVQMEATSSDWENILLAYAKKYINNIMYCIWNITNTFTVTMNVGERDLHTSTICRKP